MCAYVALNVYHRDICGCTCIINTLAHRAVPVQSLRHHVIVTRGSLARAMRVCSLLSSLTSFADDTGRWTTSGDPTQSMEYSMG